MTEGYTRGVAVDRLQRLEENSWQSRRIRTIQTPEEASRGVGSSANYPGNLYSSRETVRTFVGCCGLRQVHSAALKVQLQFRRGHFDEYRPAPGDHRVT
jgi:hypothetical protein